MVTPQNLIEFWNVATRPLNRNGFGLTPCQAVREPARLQSLFILSPDTPAIDPEWWRLVVVHAVSGAQVRDIHLAAAMRVLGVGTTLNVDDFQRYPGILAVHPIRRCERSLETLRGREWSPVGRLAAGSVQRQ